MTMEKIVRPFVSPQPLNTRRIVPSGVKKPVQTAGKVWGAVGTLPTPLQSDADRPAVRPGFNTKASKQLQVERSRVTEKVKVEQEGNPENFVMVERIKKITFGQDNPPVLKTPGGSVGTTSYAAPPGETKTIVPKTPPADGTITLDPTEYTLAPGAGA